MRSLYGGVLFAALASAAILAQAGETARTKIKVEGGHDVTVTGCVTPVVAGASFMLTHVSDKKGPLPSYMLTGRPGNLSKYQGRVIRVQGEVTDKGDAKLKVSTKLKANGVPGGDESVHRKSEVPGDAIGLPYLEVKSIKRTGARCSDAAR
jgi:hypothetical protein